MTPKLEEMILNNQARFKTRAFGLQQYNLLPCPENSTIVILGYDFQPANVVNDELNGTVLTSYQGLQRIEIKSGSKYNHFLHKMGGASVYNPSANSTGESNRAQAGPKPFHSVDGLYLVYNQDIGITVSICQEMNITPSTVNPAFLTTLVNGATSQNQDASEYSDGGNFGGTLNTSPQYSQAYGTPPSAPPDFVELNFEDTSGAGVLHRYNLTGSDTYNKSDMANAWYLLVKYVEISERLDTLQ